MVKIKIINVGTNKESYFNEGINEYVKRLKKDVLFEFISIPEYKLTNNPSENEIKNGLDKEASLIEKHISKNSFVIAMCIEGKQLTSSEFADLFKDKMNSFSSFSFIIGGSFGMSEKIKSLANMKLSMSKMTFPHTMAKLILSEQIYRAFSINSGGRYNK